MNCKWESQTKYLFFFNVNLITVVSELVHLLLNTMPLIHLFCPEKYTSILDKVSSRGGLLLLLEYTLFPDNAGA